MNESRLLCFLVLSGGERGLIKFSINNYQFSNIKYI